LLSRARAPESSAELTIKLIIQFAQDNSGIVLCYAQLHVQIVQTRLESSIKLRWVDITLISFSNPNTRPSQSRWKIESVPVPCLLLNFGSEGDDIDIELKALARRCAESA
jgi:hypothetical protein